MTPTSTPPTRHLTPGVLFLLAALAALGALATNIILPAFPAMSVALGVSVRELGATLGSFFLAFALGQLFVGPLSDRFGRQRLVLAGLAIFIIGSAVCALAQTLPQLVTGRIVQALGVCATSVLARAIARDLFEGQALARALSLTMVAMAAAPGFSPLLGSALDSLLGWRATFVLMAALALALGWRYWAHLGETHAPEHRTALSLGTVLRGYVVLLGERRFAVPAVAVSLVIGALYTFFAMAPAILLTTFGLTPLTMGLFFAGTVFVVFAAGLLAPRLAQRWGPVRAARLGLVLALAGSGLLWLLPAGFSGFAVALTVFLLGMGLFNPLGTTLTLQPYATRAGAASALLGFLQMGCAALLIAVGSLLPWPADTTLAVLLTLAVSAAMLDFLAAR